VGPAVSHLERAARARRSHPNILGNLAQAYFALARYEEALETFRKASRLEPGRPQFHMGVANSLAMLGKLSESESLLRRLASRHPGDALIWFNLGNVLRDQGRAAEAADCFVKALTIDPRHLDARNNLGGVLQKNHQFDAAEREYRACIEIAPHYPLAKCNLASVLIDVGRFAEAEAVLREVIAAAPDMSEAHAFLGAALGHQGKLREALAQHREAARLSPSSPRAVETYMSALIENGQIEEGLRWLDRALELTPGSLTANQRAYSALLSHGYMTEGWAAYESRPAAVELARKHSGAALAREFPATLAGKRVCLLREQGLGDEVFFLRFAPLLKTAGASISYRATNKILSLFTRLEWLDEVMSDDAPLPRSDVVMLLGDLPHALSRLAASPLPAWPPAERALPLHGISRRIAVFWPRLPDSVTLPPLETAMTAMRKRLSDAGKPPYIGLSWKGGTAPEQQRQGEGWLLFKEIPLRSLAETLRDIPATFVALQRKPPAGEVESFSRLLGREVQDFSDLNGDLENMLAVLALIDEYVGVSNTNMHLRAAVGRTARVLVPQPAEWRWTAAGTASPWFPGFSIYRQSLDGTWVAALAKLRTDLAATTH
jgi:tetratricopeptide (TPR) repeat protein